VVIGEVRAVIICFVKGGNMKKVNQWRTAEPRTLAVTLGFAIGLGLAVHPVFFLIAGCIILVGAGEWIVAKARELHPSPQSWMTNVIGIE
jgi:hypothetical protein